MPIIPAFFTVAEYRLLSGFRKCKLDQNVPLDVGNLNE